MARTAKKSPAAGQASTKSAGAANTTPSAETGRVTHSTRKAKGTGYAKTKSASVSTKVGPPGRPVRGGAKGRLAAQNETVDPGSVMHTGGSLEELFQDIAQSSADLAQRGIEIIERERDEFAGVGQAVADGLRQLFADGFPEGGFDVAEAVQVLAAPRLWEQRVGELLSPAEYSDVVGKSRQAVQQQITSGGLLAVRDRNARWRIPKWQVGMSAEARKALVSATRLLVDVGHLDPWSALAWTTEPHPEAAGAKPYLLVREPDGADKVVALAQRDGHAASQ